MSLLSIRAEVASKLGFSVVSNPTEKSFVDDIINKAAEEIWTKYDLNGSLKEMVLTFDGTAKQIALPYYMQVGRGFRYYNSQYKIPINGLQPRYQVQGFGQYSLNWREKFKSPLAVLITNQSILKFRITEVELTSNVTIKVIGKTPSSYRLEETITLAVGSQSAQSTNDFMEVYSISKTAPNTYDIVVYDADDTELAQIPNSELNSKYTIMQVLDDNIESTIPAVSGVEVLYKPIFHLMQNDYDEFQADGYDQAIFWKVMELWNGKQDDDAAISRAQACQIKCEQILSQVSNNALIGRDMEIQFGANPLYGMYRPSSFLGTKMRQ